MDLTEQLSIPHEDAFSGQSAELRRNYLRVLLGGALVTLTIATLRAAAWRDAPGLFHTWQVVAILAAGWIITSALHTRHMRAASWIFIGTLLLANVAEVLLFPHGPALYFFAVIGVAAALLRSERGTGLLILVNLACIAALGVYLAPALSLGEVFWPAVVTFLVSGAAWLGTHQLYTVLKWEWHSTQQSIAAAREAQEHRAELMHLNKELDGAYLRLERMNRMLILARKEAEEATALKMQFANTVSHELRSPINMILGFSDMMVNSPEVYGSQPWAPRLQNHIQQIYQSSQHLSQLIDDVLDMARIDAYRLALVKESADVEDVITETYEIAHNLFEARRLYLRVEIEPDLPPLMLDRTRIRQVLLNLLTNAVRFTQEGGVTIRAFRRSAPIQHAPHNGGTAEPTPQSQVVVCVSDTGIGIDKADLPKLFQEFGQLENVYRWSRGAGLGLFISKQLIELHGGHIWAESEAGLGTTFYIGLPTEPDGADPGLTTMTMTAANTNANTDAFWSNLEHKAQARRTLLILGDDPKVKRLLGTELHAYDMTWLPGDSSMRTCADAIEEVHPCAIIRVTGDCAVNADALAAHPAWDAVSGVPVITCHLPGLFESASAQRFLSNYLIKPISRRKLADALAKLEGEHGRIGRVLIVDDDPAMREFLSLTLGNVLGNGVRVFDAGDGATALAMVHRQRPDTVLLDLNLPDMDGFDLADQIHTVYGDAVRVIAVTARDPQAERCEGAADVITCSRAKPFARRELAHTLSSMIEGFSVGATIKSERHPN
jgi:signal transduction histidine kinase/CheY-like chemotaxis protein